MNRKFLEGIWHMGYADGYQKGWCDGRDEYSPEYEFELPYDSEAEELLGFIEEMDLRSVSNMTSPLTKEGAAWLLSRYPKELIMDVLCAMENYKGLNRKYKSAKLTANNWCKKRAEDSDQTNVNIPVT